MVLVFHTAEGGLRKQTNGMKKFTHFSHYNKTGSGRKLDIGAHALVKLRKILFHESLFPPLAVIDLYFICSGRKNTQGPSDLLKLFLRE